MPETSLIDNDIIDLQKEINRTSFVNIWQYIPIDKLHPSLQLTAHRLNALGDNFYFIKQVLRKKRLSNQFHRQYCDSFLCWSLKEVNEVPRDHFKTTLGIGQGMWWSLPFTQRDEMFMRQLGYDDAWIAWMKRAHDQNSRTLFVMEVIKNAWKVGRKITGEYKGNDFFQKLFPEIIPDSSCQWSADTMTHKRNYNGTTDPNQGEGTYEFTGVDAALQSKHYKRCIYDDLFGREALKSEVVANSTWEWVQLAVGAFDSDPDDPTMECDEVFNGNRWSFHDLNWKIRQQLPYFRFHTHDAEGGCCELHPAGVPIFPEEWSMQKLARFRQRLGEYFYSCQFRNKPIPPGGNVFKTEWLRRFAYKTIAIDTYLPKSDRQIEQEYRSRTHELSTFDAPTYEVITRDQLDEKRHMAIRHEIHEGVQFKDIPTSQLSKMLLIDPNHAGEKGRANNCILEIGHNRDPFNVYILEGFAKNCSREDAVYQAYRMAEKWRNRVIWVETSAGQTWLKTLFELEDKNRKALGKWYFEKVENFKDNRSENAKGDRIEDAEPYFRRGQIWIPSNDQSGFIDKFLEEYNEYPHSATKDILDTLGHALQNLQHTKMTDREIGAFIIAQRSNQQRMLGSRNSHKGY